MKSTLCIFFLVAIVLGNASFAQRSTGTVIKDDISDGWSDAGYVFGSPGRFDGNDWLKVAGVSGIVVGTMPYDASVRDFFRHQHGATQDAVMDAGRLYGSTGPAILVGAGIYLEGLIVDNEETRLTGREVLESLAIAGTVTTALKFVFGRSRPYTERGAAEFNGFRTNNDDISFPSGHATVAFAMSSVLASRVHDDWASVGLYTIAGITALSRIYHDQHWASDVLLGSAVGGFIGHTVVTHHLNGGKESTAAISGSPISIHLQFAL